MPVSEAKRRNNDIYNAKCDQILLRPIKPIGERIRSEAKAKDQSLQGYILDAVDFRIKTEQDGYEIDPRVLNNMMDWLKEHGHDDEDIVDFLRRIGKDSV